MEQFSEVLGLLEQSRLGSTVRVTPFLYAVLESIHILGIALLVGSAVAVDLRLLGVGRNVVPVTLAARYLLPISHAGFAVVVITGTAMFVGNALAVAASPAAPWKFGLIAVAGLNIAIFHCGIYRSVTTWDLGTPTPVPARLAAVTSVATWSGVVVAGRFLAY
jgi:hypothetical protein